MIYKNISDGYITAIGKGGRGDIEITEAEYNEIMAVISNAPEAEVGFQYKLKTDLTWDKVEADVVINPTVDSAEVMAKIEALEEQNTMLTECIMEMADIIYA